MLSTENFTIKTRLSRPELQAAKGRRAYSGNPSAVNINSSNNGEDPLMSDSNNPDLDHGGSDDDGDNGGSSKGKSKSRRELPAGAVQTLKAWLLSPEHFTHPYPTPQDQAMLMQKTGIDKKQLKNWFTNARRRIWKPMLKKQIEQGKLTTTGAPGGVALPGTVPGLIVPALQGGAPGDNPHSVQAMRMHYQQAVQGQQASSTSGSQVDAYGNQVYIQQQPVAVDQSQVQQYYLPSGGGDSGLSMHQSNSIGSLPPMTGSASGGTLNKTDSHAVLMELFARDQDLVRQATESARMKAAAKKQHEAAGGTMGPMAPAPAAPGTYSSQHPMNKTNSTSSTRLANVRSLDSWPHFSSISSLNNLGSMPGVKSITSMSGVDLASQGNVNKMGNLAQVKSMESMGKNDSYAFLEVFFGDRSMGSMSNLNARAGGSAVNVAGSGGETAKEKRDREDDNDIGLSLDDEGPSTSSSSMKQEMGSPSGVSSAPQPAPLMSGNDNNEGGNDTGTLKRAYDDALAARGLMSVSRSSENLTDLALPAKMQRSLSQEYIRQQTNPNPQQFGQYSYTPTPAPEPEKSSGDDSKQQAGQHPGEALQRQQSSSFKSAEGSATNSSVEVPTTTKCALCHQTNVDTQLRPCGHMFHERCLKPSLQSPAGVPTCPVDHIAMHSALLAVPTDDPQPPSSTPEPKWSVSELSKQATQV